MIRFVLGQIMKEYVSRHFRCSHEGIVIGCFCQLEINWPPIFRDKIYGSLSCLENNGSNKYQFFHLSLRTNSHLRKSDPGK